MYKVYAPLYKIDDKNTDFVIQKKDMVKIYQKEVMKTYKISPTTQSGSFNKDEMGDFLEAVYDYRENLSAAADSSGRVNKFFLESVIANLVLLGVVRSEDDYDDIDKIFQDQKFVKKFITNLQKDFPECKCDEKGKIFGITNTGTATIKVSRRFYKKTSDIIPVIKEYGYKLCIKEKGKDNNVMSIGEFLDYTMKLYPRILSRFKGLGELNGADLFKTTLDINNRTSIQYTVDDVERELAIFEMTHGTTPQNAADRKAMMKRYKIKREDLDN